MEHHPRVECSSENEQTTNYTYQQASGDESHNHSGEQQAKKQQIAGLFTEYVTRC